VKKKTMFSLPKRRPTRLEKGNGERTVDGLREKKTGYFSSQRGKKKKKEGTSDLALKERGGKAEPTLTGEAVPDEESTGGECT